MVEWRLIPGHHSYEVSSAGEVRRVGSAQALRTSGHRSGYRLVSLGQGTKFTVHSLVALAFIGPRPPRHDVNHKDGDKTNNRLSNLEYLSRGENHRHAYRLGLMDHWGDKNPRCKLTRAMVAQMKKLRADGWLQKDIADKFGVSAPHVSNILAGKVRQCD